MNCKILNLIKPELSDIPYHINKYPDGHKHIVLEGCEWNKDPFIDVITRISSMDELFILCQVDDILWHENIRINELCITYLLTARCDRRFSLGEAIDLNIVGEFLYQDLHCNTITLYDAHNVPDILNRNGKVNNIPVFKKRIDLNLYNVCFPDEGAYERYLRYVSKINLIGEKYRKPDGISISLKELNKLDSNKPILVIDDLCDGGKTFFALANALDDIYPDFKREIWVTHAIQKSGIELLAAKYNQVYITNSYKDWNKEKLPDNVVVYNILGLCSDTALIFQNSER